MRMRWLLGAGLVLAGLVAGCSSVVDGTGTTSGSGAPPTDSFPSQSGVVVTTAPPSTASSPVASPSTSALAGVTGCPHVVYPTAKLTYDCFATLSAPRTDVVWPLVESVSVESTGWVMEEGSGHWGPADGRSLSAIAQAVRARMVSGGAYLTSPKVATAADKDFTLNGVKAHLLQSTITLDAAAAKKRGTKVREERLWIVAVVVGTNDVSLWYSSVPDLAKQYWPKIPATINTIKVQG